MADKKEAKKAGGESKAVAVPSTPMEPKDYYAVYFTFKQWAMAAAFITLAVIFRHGINSHYSATVCAGCADVARGSSSTMFEFGVCSKTYTPNLSGSNLMPSGFFNPKASPVPFMLYAGIILAVIALGYTVALWYVRGQGSDFNDIGATSVYNLLVTALWMLFAQTLFQVYLHQGCYVSPWTERTLEVTFIANVTVAATVLVYIAINAACGERAPGVRNSWADYVVLPFFWLAFVSMFAFVGWNIYLGVLNMQVSKHWTQLIFNGGVFLAWAAESFAMWKLYYTKPGDYVKHEGSNVSAAQAKRSNKDIV